MKNANDIKKVFEKAAVDTNQQVDEKVFEKVLTAYTKNIKEQSASHRPSMWRIIMKSPIIKLAAAAVVITAVIIGIKFFGGSIDGASVVWAEVSQKMDKIKSFKCHKKESENEELIYLYSSDYGAKTEVYKDGKLTVRSYRLKRTKEIVAIFPQEKMYNHVILTDKAILEMEQMSPRQIVKRFLASDYKALGKDNINGIQVEGVEVRDQNILKYSASEPPMQDFTAGLWVDVETQLPVRLVSEYVLPGSSIRQTMVTDRFQWNIELTAGDFEPNIPAGYKDGTDQFKTNKQ